MKVIGRWMPMLGLAACLAATGCKKDEPATPSTPPPANTPPANTPPPAATESAAQATDAGTGTATDAGASPTPGSQALQQEDAKNPEWTAGRVNIARSGLPPVTLREVREGRNEGFDRVVFQFEGGQLPGYQLEYIDTPAVKCGSGDPATIAGQGWLQVRITPAQAHAEGKVTVAERERKPKLPVLEELELTCDFEGEVTWVLGVKHPNKYRVMELSNPTRLVVDVQQ